MNTVCLPIFPASLFSFETFWSVIDSPRLWDGLGVYVNIEEVHKDFLKNILIVYSVQYSFIVPRVYSDRRNEGVD